MIDDELSIKSEKTVKNAWGLIRAALSFVGYPVPPVKLAKVPINEIAFLQPEEIKPFCDALKGRSFEIPVLLELHGLRLSEVLGLDWSNIDCQKWIITVKGAKVRSLDGMTYKATNKNETSTRKVPIVIPQLKDAINAVDDKTGPVAHLNHCAILRDVKRTCQRANVTVVTNHGLRHSFASLCYHLGISERQLMQWGGWADYQTMHKIYIRLAASDESKAAEKVEGFFKSD
jgi:integrase